MWRSRTKRLLTRRSWSQKGKIVSPQRHRDTEEHLRKTTDRQVDVGASSLGFESTEEAEATENEEAAPKPLWPCSKDGKELSIPM